MQDIRIRGTRITGHAVDLKEFRAIGLNMADNQLFYKDEISGNEVPLLGVVTYREEMSLTSELYVLKDDTIYKCLINNPPELWNPDHWTAIPLTKDIFTKVDIIANYAKINGDVQQRFKVAEAVALDEAVSLGEAQRLFLGQNETAVDSKLFDGMDSNYYAIKTHDHGNTYLGLFAKAQDAYDSDTIQGHTPDEFALVNGDAVNPFEVANADMTVSSSLAINVDTLLSMLGNYVTTAGLGNYADINGDAGNVFHVKEDVTPTSALNQVRADVLYVKKTDFPTVPMDANLWMNGMGTWLPNPSNIRWTTTTDLNPVIKTNTKTLIDASLGVVTVSIDGIGASVGDTIELSVVDSQNDVNISSNVAIEGDLNYTQKVTDRQFYILYVFTGLDWMISHVNTEQIDDIELDDVSYTASMLLALKANHSYIVPTSTVTLPDGTVTEQANLGTLFGIEDIAVGAADLVRLSGNTYILYLSDGSARTLLIEDPSTPVEFKSPTKDVDLIVGNQALINGSVTQAVSVLNSYLDSMVGKIPIITDAHSVMRIVTNAKEFSFLWDHTLWAPTNPYDNTARDSNNPAFTVGSFATSFTDYTGADAINDKALGYAQISVGLYVPIIDHHGYHLNGASIKAMIAYGIGAKFKYDNTNVVIEEVFTVGAGAGGAVAMKSHMSPAILHGSTNLSQITGTLTQIMLYTAKYEGHDNMVIDQASGIINITEDQLYEVVVDAEIVLANTINPGDENKAIVIEMAATPTTGTMIKADIVDIDTVEKDTLIYKKMGTHVVHLTAGTQLTLAAIYTGADLTVTHADILFKVTKLD